MPAGGREPRQIAIYDLDGTILRRASFTPFLLFAARHRHPWRLALAPLWVAAMALYKLGLFSRATLKQFGLGLFLGHRVTQPVLQAMSRAYADRVVPKGVAQGALAAIAADRDRGCELVLATAAMEFYAGEIALRLGFDHVVASRIHPLPAQGSACLLDGGNCYGSSKLGRVEALFDALGWVRGECRVRFYSDSIADAPLLDHADEPILVNGSVRASRIAPRRGWKLGRVD